MIEVIPGEVLSVEIKPVGKDKNRQPRINGIVQWNVLTDKGLEYVKLVVDERSLNHRKATFEALPGVGVRTVIILASYQLQDGLVITEEREIGGIVVRDKELTTREMIFTRVEIKPVPGAPPLVQNVKGDWVPPKQ